MYKIVRKETFSPVTYLWEIEAPDVAKASKPGQFVMVTHGERGERIPLTIADFDVEKGTVTLVIQAIGKSTREMMLLNEGDYIRDFVGPLGLESHIVKKKKVVCVGGGLGVAPVYPQLRLHKEVGSHTISIIGFRTKELIFWEDKFRKYSDELLIATDDGSFGYKGFVTQVLKEVLDKESDIEEVIAIGPLVMMKACCDVTRPYGIKTMVSLNPVMVDGTGMCGSCRVTIGNELKFACVDGPDFDGHLVNFDELILRSRRFDKEEKISLSRWEENCKLEQQADQLKNK